MQRINIVWQMENLLDPDQIIQNCNSDIFVTQPHMVSIVS